MRNFSAVAFWGDILAGRVGRYAMFLFEATRAIHIEMLYLRAVCQKTATRAAAMGESESPRMRAERAAELSM